MNEKIKAFLETVKEPLRWLFLFCISWFIEQTLLQVNIIPEFYQINIGRLIYQVPLRTPLTIGLRLVDKYIHELGKEVKSKLLTLGITRF